MFYIISRPIYHISQPLKGPLELILPGHDMWFFPCVLLSGYSLQNVLDIIYFLLEKTLLPLVRSQSSGLLFTKDTLTFPSKSSSHTQVLAPLAAQINLPLILGKSNKIFPQCSVFNRSQPNFFICFISICVQKDCISNKEFYNPFSSNISPLFLLH